MDGRTDGRTYIPTDGHFRPPLIIRSTQRNRPKCGGGVWKGALPLPRKNNLKQLTIPEHTFYFHLHDLTIAHETSCVPGDEVSGHIGTTTDMSYGQFGTDAEVSWVRSVSVLSVCTPTHRPNY